ncbi:DUF2461 domain-containing protein [Pleomorphovibrio marinus]|uniref:DUF2461 domain-containing protein n=1 Tax=Pleomorphovibrio marinus TaxID=2164132 RepID=UPI000E0AFA45|nr:DUF2461 domain-containing protein [Pleomorphovibrio marinus]
MSRNTLQFLKELSANNHKPWMDANREWYDEVRQDFLSEVEGLLKMLSLVDPSLGILKPKDCVFRQNRDIRFSKDKRPYKENMAAYFSPKGKKSAGPGFYLHIQPQGSFLAGGVWMPPSEELKKIRQEIDYAGKELHKILSEPTFSGYFGGLEGEQLKTSPRDYEPDHPYIDLLNFKSFIVSKKLEDKEVNSGAYIRMAEEAFVKMQPFLEFLSRALEDVEDGSGTL